MKKLLLTLTLLGAIAPQTARAQDEPVTAENAPVAVAGAMATVVPFIEGLKEPQGLLLDGSGDVIVCDYGAGEVLRFGATGEKKAVLASGLKGPSQIVRAGEGRIVVSERKANRVVMLRDGKVFPVGAEIIQPVGLISANLSGLVSGIQQEPEPLRLSRNPSETVYAVAHTTSKIYRLNKTAWELVYAAPSENGKASRYGLRCLAADGDTIFVSDEVKGNVLMISRDGRAASFADGFDDPSGLAVRGDWLYVCDEGAGGKLWKVDKNGVKTLVAEKLGRPRNVLFLDDKTALVADRNGRVLKLTF